MLTENTPNIRGLAQAFGMEYIPGPWMEAIQVSKGTSSVLNGYEAIAGQINVEYLKPQTQDPKTMYLNNTVNGYRGRRYEIISSHAANTFAMAVFVSLLTKSKRLAVVLLSWAVLNAYSRIYLGVHYPGDILFGTITGCLVGWGIYQIYKRLNVRKSTQRVYVSNQYTSSGYLQKDIHLLIIVFLITCLGIVISGIIMTQIHHF